MDGWRKFTIIILGDDSFRCVFFGNDTLILQLWQVMQVVWLSKRQVVGSIPTKMKYLFIFFISGVEVNKARSWVSPLNTQCSQNSAENGEWSVEKLHTGDSVKLKKYWNCIREAMRIIRVCIYFKIYRYITWLRISFYYTLKSKSKTFF